MPASKLFLFAFPGGLQPARDWPFGLFQQPAKVIDMQRVILVAVLLFVMTNVAGAAAQSAAPASPVWRWFQNCPHPSTMGIDVTVDGTSVFKSSFPICKTTSTAADNRDGKQKTLDFTFKGGRKFQGEYQTTSAETVNGSIWQAGADADDLLLGVSFDTGKQVLLNTIQIARPDSRSVEEVDTGVFVETFPIRPN
jgi:hypothetical protein